MPVEPPPLPDKKYGVIYADPPWDYDNNQFRGSTGIVTSAAKFHYPTATPQEMMKWRIGDIAEDDCILFMWATSPLLDGAIELGLAWGFQWATLGFVWHKHRPNPGYYTMSETELCLIFKRGRIPRPRGARNIRQYLAGFRAEHSQKPEEVRRRIDAMFPTQTKIELFARKKVPGWDAWGLETTERVDSAILDRAELAEEEGFLIE